MERTLELVSWTAIASYEISNAPEEVQDRNPLSGMQAVSFLVEQIALIALQSLQVTIFASNCFEKGDSKETPL
jgi:hypothetical protein